MALQCLFLWQILTVVYCGEPWNLYHYQLYRTTKLGGIVDNASGAAYNPHTNTFWVVVNSPIQIHEYDLQGNFKRAVTGHGFWDIEGISWMYGSTFAIVEENHAGTISVVDLAGGSVWRNGAGIWLGRTSNKGIEGVAYNNKGNHFFITLEQSPQALYKVYRDGKYEYVRNLEHLGLGDISDLHYEPNQDMFYILSQESSKVVKMDSKGNKLQEIHIKGHRPEGLSFTSDGKIMIVVSEPDELALYRV